MREKLFARYRYSLILLKELVKTDFKLRYQGSVLGYLWSLLKPLFLFIILYFVFVYFLRVGSDVPFWPISMLFGIVLWNFFSEITNSGVGAIVNRGDILRKINFPKYIIVVASSVSALINLVFNLMVLVVFMVVAHVELNWSMLLTPFYIVELFIFGMGIAFILSTIYVKLRDMNMIWEVVMQALFYGSAIIYPLSMVANIKPWLAQIVLFSPITQAIQDARAALISPANITATSLGSNVLMILVPFVITVVVFVFGVWLFKKKSPSFAENV
jgi:ABC-2 type transport system permease protein